MPNPYNGKAGTQSRDSYSETSSYSSKVANYSKPRITVAAAKQYILVHVGGRYYNNNSSKTTRY
jgi:hypothetical protein